MPYMRKGRKRCLVNDGALLAVKLVDEVPRHASLLVKRFPPLTKTFNVKEDCMGFYSGPTSIAFLLFSLQKDLPRVVEGKSIIQWSKLYLTVAKTLLESLPRYHRDRSISPRWCGIACETLCWAATAAAVYGDQNYLAPVFEYSSAIVEADAVDAFDEYALGRSGYLYLLRFAKSVFPSLAAKVDSISRSVSDAMLQHSPTSATPWKFRERYYMGLSHGWLGNLVQILLSDPSQARVAQLRPMFLDILRQQLPNGNWNKFTDTKNVLADVNSDELVQISHGAPGITIGLLAVRPHYKEDVDFITKLDQAVEKAQDCIWSRGLLTKESCLLHGAAGNSLALKAPRRRMTFIALSLQEKVDEGNADKSHEPSDSPSGLHRGLAGRIWAMSEVFKKRTGVFLSFNDV